MAEETARIFFLTTDTVQLIRCSEGAANMAVVNQHQALYDRLTEIPACNRIALPSFAEVLVSSSGALTP